MAAEQTESGSQTSLQSTDSRIEVDNIRKTFNQGEVVACEDISLDIAADEFVVFLGPSGCGKTTTLRCISGLEQPDDGSIRIDGEDVTTDKPKDRDLAFVFQSIALFPHLSVRENIRFGLDMKTDLSKEEKRERVEEVAEMLDIGELLDRKPSALSGGQQQRVSLGRAMVMNPAAFLLDEPFSALDAQLRDQMRTEVKRLQRKLGTAMIFVTHDQEEAMTLGDKIVVMDDGHIQQVGNPHEIYNDPENVFVARFIGSPSINELEGSVTDTSDGLVVSTDLFDVEFAESAAQSANVSRGDRLTLAVRPEHLDLQPETSLFEADVELVEPHGARDAVYLTESGINLAATVNQGVLSGERDRVSVDIDRENVWLFDERGQRII
ncbi:multiple sugar transport system ATP-binding protein [Halogeometricum rufum]|uniref:ABC-type D-xylose/L-arabinose transporter n=1 Tax=Halogeometricum rufum TaxID=553469 RepID=A0A1I6IFM9_9EURY|nr:ABC transporter ATP-binding protein [Halogeometricum rufum]SFR65508.1 multiple sugar transport system ATP-binding protein [Halogeometricum rufum]